MCQREAQDYKDAYAVGKALGAAGFTVMTGGYKGVMEAASHGAHDAGGHVVGVTTTRIEVLRGRRVNDYVKEQVGYANLLDRLVHLINQADGYVTMPGGLGTLAELVMVWELMRVEEIPYRPLICFGSYWKEQLAPTLASQYIPEDHKALVRFVETPEAVVMALREVQNERG